MKFIFKLLLICAFISTPSLLASQKPEKAYIIRRLDKCKNIEKLKRDGETYIFKISNGVIYYEDFIDENNKVDIKDLRKRNVWQIYDLLYEDAPAKYENGLVALANKNYGKAKTLFEESLKEKTKVTKKAFSTTTFAKNHIDDKLLACAQGLKLDEDIANYFKKVVNNETAHARRRVMLEYAPYLIKKGEGLKANNIIDQCLKFQISRKVTLELQVLKCEAIAMQRKFSQAKSELKKVELSLLNKEDLKLMPKIVQTSVAILVKHEKDYSEGIRFLKKIMTKSKKNLNSQNYFNLAECYMNKSNFEEARWNYIQAFINESQSPKFVGKIKDKILAMNDKIESEQGNDALNKFLRRE